MKKNFITTLLAIAASVSIYAQATLSNVIARYNNSLTAASNFTADLSVIMRAQGQSMVQQGKMYFKAQKYRVDYTGSNAMSMIAIGSNSYMRRGSSGPYTSMPSQSSDLNMWGQKFLDGLYLKETMNDGNTVSFSAFKDAQYTQLASYGTFNIASALLMEMTLFRTLTEVPQLAGKQVQTKSVYGYTSISGIPMPTQISNTITISGMVSTTVLEFRNIVLNGSVSDSLFAVQ